MHVTVRLFGRLRDISGSRQFQRELPDGATASALWDLLEDEHSEMVPYRTTVSVAVNEEYAKMDIALAEGDEIVFLPPVSGG